LEGFPSNRYYNDFMEMCQMEIRLKGVKAYLYIIILVLGVINCGYQLFRLWG